MANSSSNNSNLSKTMRFDAYDAYGFDIDHTLAKYKIPKLFDQIHYSLTTFLVKNKGYDACIAEPLDKHFIMRGIVLDIKKGNFLKLAEDGTILGASHGTKFMSKDKIKAIYGEQMHWPLFEKMIETVNNLGNEVRIFENFFDMPIMMTAARLIDLLNTKEETPDTYDVFWSDLMEAAMDAYDPNHFALERGNFFPQFKKQTADFLQPCSDDVKVWLKKLKASGKTVFIATSSFNDYACFSMEFILGSDWKDYFDFFFTFAKKPGFFKLSRNFLRVENFEEKEPVQEVIPGVIYSQGNSETFMKDLRKHTGKAAPRVLFFGDSLRSDVFPSKVYSKWDTVLVLEEMLAEQHTFKPEAVVEPGGKRIKLQEPSDLEKDYLTSDTWGSFFTDGNVKNSRDELNPNLYTMNTLWGFIVRKYADIAIPQLEYIADLQMDHEFTLFNHETPLDWGFYPGIPLALQRNKDEK